MRYLIIVWVAFFLVSCNPEEKAEKNIQALEKAGDAQKHELGIACMQYISQHGDDSEFSKRLVKKLLDLSFFVESINAVEILLKKYPAHAELFFLRGLGYRNLHQYDLAKDDFDQAMRLQPQNNSFSAEATSMREELKRWQEIQILDNSLMNSSDSAGILLDRAEKYFAIRQYDAVLYDLGALSKMGSAQDSLYFSNKVAALYNDAKRPMELLGDMLEYYKGVKKPQ